MTTFRSSLAAALALASPAGAQDLALPSGLAARLHDVVLEAAGAGPIAPDAFTDPEGEEDAGEPEGDEPLDAAPSLGTPSLGTPSLGAEVEPPSGGVARFRLVVAGLGGAGADYDTVAGDFAWLCETLALPALAANGWTPTEVVVSLADREVAFGAIDADAVQFFEGFRIEAGACVPQAF